MALHIDDVLVRHLVVCQFPMWADLPIVPVVPGGRDNRTFRLGDDMLVRLPSASEYAPQVEKEQCWLPRLALSLPLAISTPLGIGQPAEGYPWKWSVYRWLEGDPLADNADLCGVASSLAQFLTALQRIDPTGGPRAGPHNFYRGGALTIYDAQTRHALAALKGRIDVDAATRGWETARASDWSGPPKWVHGDIAAGNLLVNTGRLSAVIDFGQLGVGDVACDLAIAWTQFEGKSREVFRESLPLDSGTWARGRGWALWKALIVSAQLVDASASEQLRSMSTIAQVLADHGEVTSTSATDLLVEQVDPQGQAALSLLREATVEARQLYLDLQQLSATWPTNAPTPDRGVYVVGFVGGTPVACGALRPLNYQAAEVRRVFVLRDHRRRGFATAILDSLERYARNLGFSVLRLETGNRQQAAMALYQAYGFERIAPFGEYATDPTSVCFEKRLSEARLMDRCCRPRC